jgi:hypothetical protein
MVKCLECGSTNIHVVAYNTEIVRPSMLEPANGNIETIKNSDLPYILGGHFCCECQRLVSVYDDESFRDHDIEEKEPLASLKQKKYVKDLLSEWEKNPAYRSEYKDLQYDTLTASFANSIIADLLNKQKKNVVKKKEVAKATEKQINLIKKKCSENPELAEKYKNINYDKLNIITAKKIITEILN